MQEELEKSQRNYKARHDKHRVDKKFQVGDEVWLYISKERIQGEGKILKPIHYGPFKILENTGNNAFKLDFPSYMQIHSIVDVENLRLFEPPLIDDQGENVHLPSIDDVWDGEDDEDGGDGGDFPPFPLESFFSSFLSSELPSPCGGLELSPTILVFLSS